MELWDYSYYAGGAAAFLAALWFALHRRRVQHREDIVAAAEDECYDEAALRAEQRGDYAEAQELYMLAGQSGQAAFMAEHAGRVKQAAELHEWAGQFEDAARCYEASGQARRAEELRIVHGICVEDPQEVATATPSVPASSPAGDAAEALLAAGDVAGAALAYAEAGHTEEAVNLYVNALAEPGRAAELLRERGESRRAAELFERSGNRSAAAEAWTDVSLAEGDPLSHLSRIESLDADCAARMLETWVEAHPLSPETADAHVACAELAQRRGRLEEALSRFREIARLLGNVHDVESRISELSEGAQRVTVGSSAPPPGAEALLLRPEQLVQMLSQVANAAAKKAHSESRVAPPVPSVSGTGWSARYELREELGRGGMAVVYRAFDQHLERDVAMKFMAESLGGERFEAMFLREARAVAALSHQNIVTIFDSGVSDGRLYICMEYVRGKSLEERLVDGGLRISESLRIVEQVLVGLHHAHEHNIVHRDIKPGNIMCADDGRVKLMDFGLAKPMNPDEKASVIAGTPAYMPLEQLMGGKIDRAADIFAVGVTIFEMLTQRFPFAGKDRVKAPPKLSAVRPGLPVILDEVVARALELDPRARWATAKAMAAPIRRVLDAVDRHSREQGAAATQAQTSERGAHTRSLRRT